MLGQRFESQERAVQLAEENMNKIDELIAQSKVRDQKKAIPSSKQPSGPQVARTGAKPGFKA